MKKIISILILLMMILMTNTVYAKDVANINKSVNNEISVRGIVMKNGDYLENGKSATQTTVPSEGYAYYKDGVLTLDNFNYKGSGGYSFINGTKTVIYGGNAPLTIHLKGKNYIKHTALGYGITSNSDVTIEGTGTLKIDNDYSGIYLKEYGNLIINSGILELDSIRGAGLQTFNGNITINGGTISARNNGINYEDYYYYAINPGSGALYIAEGISVKASTEPNGETAAFDYDKIKTYDYVVITDGKSVNGVIIGDINEDGYINSIDSHCLKLYIAGIGDGNQNKAIMNLYVDDNINAKDLLVLKKMIAGIKY